MIIDDKRSIAISRHYTGMPCILFDYERLFVVLTLVPIFSLSAKVAGKYQPRNGLSTRQFAIETIGRVINVDRK